MADSDYRMIAGTVSQFSIENDSSTIVTDWTQQDDQPGAYPWHFVQASPIQNGLLFMALDGTVKSQGGLSGEIEFAALTQDMIEYLWTNIFQSKFSNAVTIRTWHQRQGWIAINCRLFWNGLLESSQRPMRNTYSNIRFAFKRGVVADYGNSFSASFSASFG